MHTFCLQTTEKYADASAMEITILLCYCELHNVPLLSKKQQVSFYAPLHKNLETNYMNELFVKS
jgi:hypothetical protein